MINPRAGQSCARLKIGLFGGSFNPAHQGHLAMSRFALKRLGLDQVWWLVSPQNPLKPEQGMADYAERLGAASALAINDPHIKVTDIEAMLGTRYTVDTLRALKRAYPRTRFVWLMGADNMRQIPRWREWVKIFSLVPVAVFRRPLYAAGRGRGTAAQRLNRFYCPSRAAKVLAAMPPPAWIMLDNRLDPTSATAIRNKVE